MFYPHDVRSVILIAIRSAIEFFTQKKVKFDIFSALSAHRFTILIDHDEPMEG